MAKQDAIVDGTDRSLLPTTDRILTVPNVLSGLRLVGIPVFLYLILGPRADGWALAIVMASGWTDFFDGKIARKYGQISRLGQVLDPLADRLFVVSTVLALALREMIPWWLVAALLARDALLATLLPVLTKHGYGPLPVHFIGKAATWNLLYALPLLMLGAGISPIATASRALGWAFAIWGTSLYWWAGVLYAVQVRQLVRADATPAREGAPA